VRLAAGEKGNGTKTPEIRERKGGEEMKGNENSERGVCKRNRDEVGVVDDSRAEGGKRTGGLLHPPPL
jgi:hypothetical protein